MIGEWEPTNQTKFSTLPEENKIIGHVVNRLREICYPEQPGAPKPIFPQFFLKAVLLGKPFAGKTNALKNFEQCKIYT
jgi:hypothetical protein